MRKMLILLTLLAPLKALAFMESIMPKNTLSREDSLSKLANVSQVDFNDAIAKVEAFYKPIVALHGGRLVMERDWKNSTVNAYATKSGSRWIVHLYGGLARRPEINKDSFTLVILHEMGHHLGGFPAYDGENMSDEGQADYFATHSGARELWAKDIVENAKAAAKIPAYPKALCDKQWVALADRNLCYRIALAGKGLADLMSQSSAKYETPDQSEVESTNHSHPAGQCRLDTYLAGAQCLKVFAVRLIPWSEQEAALYNCVGEEVGARPRCWFKGSL